MSSVRSGVPVTSGPVGFVGMVWYTSGDPLGSGDGVALGSCVGGSAELGERVAIGLPV